MSCLLGSKQSMKKERGGIRDSKNLDDDGLVNLQNKKGLEVIYPSLHSADEETETG